MRLPAEAIFGFTSSAPTVAVGDAVSVSGTPTEFRAGGASDVETSGVFDPASDGIDLWESSR